jgi:hypothetical protein
MCKYCIMQGNRNMDKILPTVGFINRTNLKADLRRDVLFKNPKRNDR